MAAHSLTTTQSYRSLQQRRRMVMFRRFVCLSVGALALMVVLGAPGQLHAQHMRGGFPHAMHPGFHGMMPGFHGAMPGFRGGVDTPFNSLFTPGFARRFIVPRLDPGGVVLFRDFFGKP